MMKRCVLLKMHDSVLLIKKCGEGSHQALCTSVSLKTKLSSKEDLHISGCKSRKVNILNFALSLIWKAHDL